MPKKLNLVVLLCLAIVAALSCGCLSGHVKNVSNANVSNVSNVNNANMGKSAKVNSKVNRSETKTKTSNVESVIKPIIADVFGGANKMFYQESGHGENYKIEIVYRIPRKISPDNDLTKLKAMLNNRGFNVNKYVVSPNGLYIGFNSSSIKGNFTIIATGSRVIVLYKSQ